ncbi:MAG: dTDP-4-dehydrorhamnose reductase [Parcubacteria group bacterium]|nr:dTDP-4-dehydrorhamnose reductase [Parcubacteria group bacterium]
MKVLIIGSKGMLGQELVKKFKDEGEEVFAWDREEIDITKKDEVVKKVGELKPDVLINAAAFNAVDEAEEKPEMANSLNGYAIRYLAQAVSELNTTFIHYSTDYVFNGNRGEGYRENHAPCPISKYGESKLLGEKELQKNSEKYYIIRLSRLFGKSGSSEVCKRSFVEVMKTLSETQDELDIVDEEFASITYAPDLTELTYKLIKEKSPYGIYHGVNSGACTWYGFAKEVFKVLGKDTKVNPVSSEKFPRLAKRPAYSVLLNTKLPPQRSWQEALKEYLL